MNNIHSFDYKDGIFYINYKAEDGCIDQYFFTYEEAKDIKASLEQKLQHYIEEEYIKHYHIKLKRKKQLEEELAALNQELYGTIT